jgi:hypothetical protein
MWKKQEMRSSTYAQMRLIIYKEESDIILKILDTWICAK